MTPSALQQSTADAFAHAAKLAADRHQSLLVFNRPAIALAWREHTLRFHPRSAHWLTITTYLDLARSLVPHLVHIGRTDQARDIAGLLRGEFQQGLGTSLWPSQRRYLPNQSFADAVTEAMAERDEMLVNPSTFDEPKLAEIAAFAYRYEHHLERLGQADSSRIFRLAAQVTANPSGMIGDPERPLTFCALENPTSAHALFAAGLGQRLTLEQVSITEHHQPLAPVLASTAKVRVHHGALEAEAIVGQIMAWLAQGHQIDRIAIALPQWNPVLVTQLHAAARRAGLSAYAPRTQLSEIALIHQVSAAIENATEPLHDAAFSWWLEHSQQLLGDQSSVRALRSFIRALSESSDLTKAHQTFTDVEAGDLAIVSIDDLVNRPPDCQWSAVAIAQCVDGVFPRRQLRAHWFASLSESSGNLEVSERARLTAAHHAVRPHGSVVAFCAPPPGVLPSSFVDDWPAVPMQLAKRSTINSDVSKSSETTNEMPVFPSGALRLSATQLNTFEDCSWRYAFEYGLGLRGAGGAPASAGTLVHQVLEEFLVPGGLEEQDRTIDTLLSILDATWDESAFPYTVQSLDYRRRAEQWLTNWFDDYLREQPRVAQTEFRFSVPLADTPHILTGSIDRLDVLAPQPWDDEPHTRVVDYKSGSAKSQSEVDEDLQLAIYHYAATNDPTLRAIGKPERLELHYLQEDGAKTSVKVLARHVNDSLAGSTEAQVLALADQILAEGYEPNIDANCDYCAFHSLCPIQAKGQQL